MRKAICCTVCGMFLVACAAPSQYRRTTAAPGEIVWGYAGGLEATVNGQVVARGADSWNGMEQTVACVPRAAELARVARREQRKGSIYLWTAVGALLAIPGGGGAMMGVGLAEKNDALTGAGLGVMFGGLVVGLVLTMIGAKHQNRVLPQVVDAANIYNDTHATSPACSPRR